MDSLRTHYQELLQLDAGWQVEEVDLDLDANKIRIPLIYKGKTACCAECRKPSRIHDFQPKRSWRHLDALQCETVLEASTPRVHCETHGVTRSHINWAEKSSRFTLMFEELAIKVLQAAKTTKAACFLLNINWEQAHSIKESAVLRGLERRKEKEIPWVGMDEKSFRKGHDYISVLNDLEGGKVLDVEEGRSSEVAEKLIEKALTSKQREMVCGACIDMSAPFKKAIEKHLVNADVVHDKFHISQHLNNAVDITRRKENKELRKQGNESLVGTKFQWLKKEIDISDKELKEIQWATARELKVSQAYYLKELFRSFWEKGDRESAKNFLFYWAKLVIDSGNQPMFKVLQMIHSHLDNILTYFETYITNAVSEGINSKIQSIKASARGFRSFKNYRIAILFHCGKLKLLPQYS